MNGLCAGRFIFTHPHHPSFYPSAWNRLVGGSKTKRVHIKRRGDEVAVQFEYDKKLVEIARGLEQRRYDPETKEWLAPISYYQYVVKQFEAVDCIVSVDEEIERLLLEGKKFVRDRPQVRVRRFGNDYVLDFEFNDRVVKAVKSLPERSFDPITKAWYVPIREPKETLEEILYHLEFAECEISLPQDLRTLLTS